MVKDRTVVNLKAKINRELMESTREASVESVQWCEQVLVVGLLNGNIMSFDIEG